MQGSTYNTVIVSLTDMLNAPTNGQEISSLIYTGMTRAAKCCYLVNKDFTPTVKYEEPESEV